MVLQEQNLVPILGEVVGTGQTTQAGAYHHNVVIVIDASSQSFAIISNKHLVKQSALWNFSTPK
jgi:hypothetical protein